LDRAKKLPGFDSQVVDELLFDCLTMRLRGLPSSISTRIGCKSSVAETTGNSSVRTQIKSKETRRRPGAHECLAWDGSCRQSQIAGNASVSQRRLSNSSIESWNPNYIKKVAGKTSRAPFLKKVTISLRASQRNGQRDQLLSAPGGLFFAASLSQKRNGLVLSARKELRVSQWRTLDHFTWPLIMTRKSYANRQIGSAIQQ
jgi:hypothetical protein